MFLKFFILVISLVLAKAKCPSGSIPSYSDSSICYAYQNTVATYLDAETNCKNMGGHLVTIPNMYENLFIAQNANKNFNNSNIKDFWTGANDLYVQGQWMWIDGTTMSFTDWDSNQPKNASGYDCGSLKISTGHWESDNCYTAKKAFVCGLIDPSATVRPTTGRPMTTQKATSPRPTGSCPSGWTQYSGNGGCYQVFTNSLSWQNAEADCVNRGGHLASIHSLAEDMFVANLALPNEFTWIGHSTTDFINFNWTDGTPFDYYNWYPGYPEQSSGFFCGDFYSGDNTDSYFGTWHNYLCQADSRFSAYACKLS